jgi:hypothetical protein
LAAYILFSYYQQQKQAIKIVTTPDSISTSAGIPNGIKLDNGAFALSLWIKLSSAMPSSSTFNIMSIQKQNNTSPILSLTIDASGNLVVSYPFLSSTHKTSIMLFPIDESVNIVLNYNGDDDIDPDKNETIYDPTTNTNIPIYNPDANTFYNGSKRALDVYINGLLNNTIPIDTLTNSKAAPDSPAPYITYMDPSMNYVTTNDNQVVVGIENNQLNNSTISNATFIKHGCSPRDVENIFNKGQHGSILENLLSYKLRFSFVEDDKEIKTYDLSL